MTAVNEHCGPFLQWCVCQGVCFVLQNRYQRRRMYTRIALGKNSNMDVVAGESSGANGQLLSLLPFLFGLQALQMYVGWRVFQLTYHTILTPEGWLVRLTPPKAASVETTPLVLKDHKASTACTYVRDERSSVRSKTSKSDRFHQSHLMSYFYASVLTEGVAHRRRKNVRTLGVASWSVFM
jgi:hypothetical protein